MPELSIEQGLLIVSVGSVFITLGLMVSLFKRPLFSFVFLLVFLPTSAGLIVLTQDVYSYRNLAEEQKIARVVITQRQKSSQKPTHYNLNLIIPDQGSLNFAMLGDQWQLEARVLRWNLTFARLGVANLIRLDRLSNRFSDIEDQRSQEKLYYRIPNAAIWDTWPVLQHAEFLRKWVEVDYGNAVYAPLRDGAAYNIYLGRSGLFLQPENPIAKEALQDWSS